jgi:hypothetical protein
MTTRKFWPLDFDPEGEIYENVAWDLPGFRLRKQGLSDHRKPANQTPRSR